jgi:Uma2 family endonuclease
MTVPIRLHKYTYDQYVRMEPYSDIKHEFFDGEIYAMSGGTEDHSALAVAVLRALDEATDGGPCKAHTADMRIYVESIGLATYPDASVICGPLQHHDPSPKDTALNPTVIVEVMSDSSEDYDRGFKLEAYQTIPTLREYVIVSHRERRIIVHRRDDKGWRQHTAIAGGKIAVESIGAELVVDTIYRKSSIS